MGRKMKRILALCLCMLMVLSVVPKSVFAAENDEAIAASDLDAEVEEKLAGNQAEEISEAEEKDFGGGYDVWVGGVQITTSNKDDVLGDGTVKYEVDSYGNGTLILNNAVIENGYGNPEWVSAIYSLDSIDIELKGSNRLGRKVSSIDKSDEYSIVYGIHAGEAGGSNYKSVSLFGNGDLEIYDRVTGVYASDISIDMGGRLSVTEFGNIYLACCLKAMGSGVSLYNGIVNLQSYESMCVYGQLKVAGGSINMLSYGVKTQGSSTPGIMGAINSVPTYGTYYTPVIYAGTDPTTIERVYDQNSLNIITYCVQIFQKNGYEIFKNPMEHGDVKVEESFAEEGQEVSFTVIPEKGYMLDEIHVVYGMSGECLVSSKNTFTMPDYDVIINATFKKIPNMDPVDPLGISIMHNDARGIEAFLMTSGSMNYSTFEIAWYYSNDGGISYTELSDFQYSNAIIDFPTQKLNYLIVAKTRVNQDDSTIRYASYSVDANVGIKGICQMPNPNGSGYLIGIETKYDPDNEYTVEMLILDCSLLAKNEDAWVYTTGRCGTTDNCLWTIWDPQYGYYWTLFRVYDRNGNLVEEQCYGFENI